MARVDNRQNQEAELHTHPTAPMSAAFPAVRPRARVRSQSQAHVKNFSSGVADNVFGGHASGNTPAATGGLDFLSRVEQAERRDESRLSHRGGPPSTNPYAQRTDFQRMRDKDRQGSLVFGDDAPPTGHNTQSMYETTNGRNQLAMTSSLKQAHERHEETVLKKIMIEQHGMSMAEANVEIKLYRQEQAAAAGGRPHTPSPMQQPIASKMTPQRCGASAMQPHRHANRSTGMQGVLDYGY